jgi:Xaa-Pro aminopeptidase
MTMRRYLLPWLLAGAPAAAAAQEPAPPPIDTAFFKGRRAELMRRLGDGVALILASPPPAKFRPFFQSTEFYYLTGVTEPGLALLLVPDREEELLLVHPFNRFYATWDGERLAPGAESEAKTGVADVGNVRQLASKLEELLAPNRAGKRPVLWTVGQQRADERRSRGDAELTGQPSAGEALVANLVERFPGLQIEDLTPHINAMRGVKTPPEIEQVRRSTEIACHGIAEAMKSTDPGMYEYQVAAVARYVFSRLGAGHDAYPAIVGAGPNGCVLHYNACSRQLQEDDLIVMDYGGTLNGYATDVTRTFPANGVFTPAQRKLVEDVYDVQQQLIAAVRPGVTLSKLSAMCSQLLAKKGYRAQHGPSHHVGLDVHDQGDDRLESGMIITVEPGAYLVQEGMGCRIEDVVLVTEDGCEVLSGHLPSRPDDIEKLMTADGIAQQPVGLKKQS